MNRFGGTGLTTYSKRVPYQAYDVTALLRVGRNCLGAMVGHGWWNPLPLRMYGLASEQCVV
jgi:alpha-L-rhamnosidase